MRRAVQFAGALSLAVLAASCSSDSLSPFQPEITNATDNFQLQATAVQNVTTTKTYTWHNNGTVANVNHSTTTTGGSALLTIRAANGSQVYNQTLVASRNEQTATGPAGDWTIVVTLNNYGGSINFRVQKP